MKLNEYKVVHLYNNVTNLKHVKSLTIIKNNIYLELSPSVLDKNELIGSFAKVEK